MAVSDILRDIGQGLERGAKAAVPVLERTAQVVSGEAPQLDQEERQRQQKMEDEQIAAKASVLESNLAIGQKYGTLTPAQQQQYVDEITGLYSHPRHAGVLMEKLRKAIHPQGAVSLAPQPPLPNPVPAGGTAAQDEKLALSKRGVHPVPSVKPFKAPDGLYYQPMYDADGRIVNEQIEGYNPPPVNSGGKSPPLPGNMLPADAVGPNGEQIGEADRSAAKSFVEFGGAWWPVAKPKPVFKTVRGHSVLADPQTGNILRDLGPTGTARVTSRQTLQPGDDGQMHMVTLTSVSTPEGATIDVQPEENSPEQPDSTAPQTPSAPRKGVGSVLPKKPTTGAKPVSPSTGTGAGPIVPGLSALARWKNPLFKADAASYKKANDDAIAKGELYKNAAGLLADNARQTDLDLLFAWVRSNIQGAGRLTNTEITQAAKAGSWGTRINSAFTQASTGRIAPELEQQFLRDIKRSADTAQQTADDLKRQLGEQAPAPSTGDSAVDEFLKKF